MTPPEAAPMRACIAAYDHLATVDPVRMTAKRGNPGLLYTAQNVVDAFKAGASTHRGWLIEQNWIGEWEATHPDFDGPEDGRHVSAKTRVGVVEEIDTWLEEHSA